jgi:uroporphyrin-III C-methyltransferase/precorrin-2 dehydrogenase/sirohydrochlorin ferrochelatase
MLKMTCPIKATVSLQFSLLEAFSAILEALFRRAKQRLENCSGTLHVTRALHARGGLEGLHLYPVMLDIRDRRCLVVGGGGVALRKVQGLVEDGAQVTVVAPEVVEPLEEMSVAGRINLELRRYRDGESRDYGLVFAATDDREVNERVFRDADDAGIWVNVADVPDLCSFHLPARVRRGPLQLAIGSAGEAPFAVARLRRLLERRFGQEWGEWLSAASRYRIAVRAMELAGPEANQRYDRFFDATVDGDGLTARVPTEEEEREWLEMAVDHRRVERSSSAPDANGCREVRSGEGFVSLVGAGPGCPGLLTVRGLRRLEEADAVVFDRLAATALPCDLPPTVELHPVGKVAGTHPIPQEEINALLVRLAREGKRVVRFKGGDPYVFGRGGEEAEDLQAAGISFEVISGVTSGVAALAWGGIPATHRRESVRLNLLTAHEAIKTDGPQVRWDLLAQDEHATLVGYMGVSALPKVVENLLDAGMDPATPAAMVEQGTTAAQKRVVSTLEELPRAVERAGLQPPALFAIGSTVRHAERLDWYGGMPLAGRRLLMTSSNLKLASMLENEGAEVVVVPMPVTPAARIVIGALPLTGCLVQSRAEVDWLDEERENPGWGSDALAWCIGFEASERARECGWQNIVELEEDLACDDLVSRIATSSESVWGGT